MCRLICNGSDFNFGYGVGCLQFYYCMNGFHTGLLRVFVRQGDGPPRFIWIISGDLGPGWKSVSLDLVLTPETEVALIQCIQCCSGFTYMTFCISNN